MVFYASLGFFLFSYVGSKLKLAIMPDGLKFVHIIGAGLLGGFGFTMSIFITLLAFDDAGVTQELKIAIILASLFSGFAGYILS